MIGAIRRLSSSARAEEALIAAEEAVRVDRRLAAAEPAAFTGYLRAAVLVGRGPLKGAPGAWQQADTRKSMVDNNSPGRYDPEDSDTCVTLTGWAPNSARFIAGLPGGCGAGSFETSQLCAATTLPGLCRVTAPEKSGLVAQDDMAAVVADGSLAY